MFSWGQTAMNTFHTPSFLSVPSLIRLTTKKDAILTFIPQCQHATDNCKRMLPQLAPLTCRNKDSATGKYDIMFMMMSTNVAPHVGLTPLWLYCAQATNATTAMACVVETGRAVGPGLRLYSPCCA